MNLSLLIPVSVIALVAIIFVVGILQTLFPSWLRWNRGRQSKHEPGYENMLLLQIGIPGLFAFDLYLVRFEPNFFLPEHRDLVEWGDHYRANLILRGKGKFICENTIVNTRRLIVFRPDREFHSMQNGPTKRLILSLGFVHRN